MTAKNRQKSGSGDKGAASAQEDASKRSPKSPAGNGASGPGPGSGSGGPRSRSCLGVVATALFYAALVGSAGFAAFHAQQVVREIRQTMAGHERSAAELNLRLEGAFQQMASLKSVVHGLESSLGITQVEMEGAISLMKNSEVEIRRVKEALLNLQNDLLRDLSEGINEVKEAREKDFSSLEKTVEERLAEVSQSIKTNMAEFTEAQGEVQTQLANLKARLGAMEDPALIKQELSAFVDTLAEIKSAKETADSSVTSLSQQIGSVRAELQTRNQEVASMSEEIQTVRSVVQENIGSLKQALAETEAGVQALKDKTLTVESGAEQAADALRNVEKQVEEAAARAQKRSDDLEARVKVSEENGGLLSASMSEMTSKVESLLAQFDTHKSSLAAQGVAVEDATHGLEQELEALRNSMEEQQAITEALRGAQSQLAARDSTLDEQVGDLKKRTASLEERSSSSSVMPEQLETLRSAVDGLEGKAAKLEGHDQAIAALQRVLQETTQTLAGLSRAPGGTEN